MRILKGIKYLFITTLGILLLITFLGLTHRFTNPGFKSISLMDLKYLVQAITINTIFLLLIILIIQRTKRKNGY